MTNKKHIRIGVAAAAFAAGATAVVSRNKKEAHKRKGNEKDTNETVREYTTVMVTMKPSLIV